MSVFDKDWTKLVSDAEAAHARDYGDLVWADGNLFVYKLADKLYVMEPPLSITEDVISLLEKHPAYTVTESQEEVETAPVADPFDPAVLMQLTSELAYALWQIRNVFSQQLVSRPFTMQEHEVLSGANEVLDIYASEYGIDWDEFAEQDKLLRG